MSAKMLQKLSNFKFVGKLVFIYWEKCLTLHGFHDGNLVNRHIVY